MKYTIFLVPILLAGCAGAPAGRPAVEFLSDGSKAWQTSCLGATPSDCYKKAYNQCTKGIVKIKLTTGRATFSKGHTLYYKCK